ncbi:50S ribosomal protein L3 N(5)-glutamine methyltransferase [Amphritea balenae]|uniref:Ribosomal protein uL3 glutamine methyltransferase n=1 Tax=Amphritea balenae TaxID=452629 RepID=A0A3P1SLE3_9GAMM|nr:50S ribosomal protein L3 N(5)-glutamine methyltransferase [Amphritea balenae]RRC97764.1 50S ribosomal protein L3 N(5)-glutamine methyltransferase [Amphritea balenae]GGK82831.1 50S ribosomal protein L3 glutamine methyltransferase [Amphritea balenae]
MTINQVQICKELHTIRDFIRFSMSRFYEYDLYFGHGTDNPWDEAVQLVLGALHLPWNSDPALLDARLTGDEKARVLDFVEQRVIQRRPLPYIIGEAWYAGMPFCVDERVLIPRSPVQELIEQHFSPWLREGPVERILDLCTGSGCIGIVCAYAFEEAEVDLADISTDALDVAQKNIARHELGERVTAIESDLFSNLQGRKYDLIISNPPYVDQADLSSMPDEYQHEPDLALGSGPDGLDITKQILRQATQFLADDGLLVVEVGNSEVHLQQQYPQIPFTWLELEQGGNGIFLLTAQEVKQYCGTV